MTPPKADRSMFDDPDDPDLVLLEDSAPMLQDVLSTLTPLQRAAAFYYAMSSAALFIARDKGFDDEWTWDLFDINMFEDAVEAGGYNSVQLPMSFRDYCEAHTGDVDHLVEARGLFPLSETRSVQDLTLPDIILPKEST